MADQLHSIENYEGSRTRFRNYLPVLRQAWPGAHLITHTISTEEDLTQDWISAEAVESKERAILFTTGEHGIEGYMGSAAMNLFIEELVPRLDPRTTGLNLVHAINPWGMKHFRRTNSQNVDINRNFILDPAQLNPESNPDYKPLNPFLNPTRTPGSTPAMRMHFITGLLLSVLAIGTQKLQKAVLLGQYAYPQGIYYGGSAIEKETKFIMELFQQVIGQYNQTCLLDMHTGYGPRYLMSIVNSALEKKDSAEFVKAFNYPNVVKSSSDEFYAIQGDMIDYFYRVAQTNFPDKSIYGTTFEFGTLGDSFPAVLRSLATMIDENWIYWHGEKETSAGKAVSSALQSRFHNMYYPAEKRWREKAIDNARQAFEGILTSEGFIHPSAERKNLINPDNNKSWRNR